MAHFAIPHMGALAKRSWARWVGTRRGHSRAVKGVAVPGYFLQWLGIAEQDFADACCRRGLQAFSFISTASDRDPWQPDSDVTCPGELEEAATYAACVESNCLPSELGADHAQVQRRWRQVLASRFAGILDAFRRQQPSVVLLLQGFEPHNAAARAAALRLGIPVVALENTALAHRLVWDNVSGITTNRSLARSYFWRFKDRVDAQTCHAYCANLIENTKRYKSAEHTSPAGSSHFTPARPTVLFLGQVYTDASQVFGLRHWASPLEVLASCVQWCRQHDHLLVVKLHPKEKSGINTVDGQPYNRLTYRKIRENEQLFDGLTQLNAVIDEENVYDTYELIDHCRLAVTVNSQSGLEAAIRDRPVVVCGEAFYGGLDMTCDAPGPAYFDSAMSEAIAGRTQRTAAARQFAYIFFEKYCREKNVETLIQLVEENLL